MWDERYSENEFAFGTQPNDFLKSFFSQIPKTGKVLCLAEGEGRNAVFLAKQGYEVTAVDQSAVGLEKANKLAADNDVNINTVVSDLENYDFGANSWDGIVSISAHVPATLRKILHARVSESLKPDGIFILEAYTPRHLDMPGIGGPPADKKDFFMSLDTLRDELKPLSFIHGIETERCLAEGKYHQGESAVVQVIARKDL